MTEQLDWKTLWSNPAEIMRIILENEKSLIYLRNFEKRLLEEERRLYKKIGRKGYIYEQDRKKALIQEVGVIDPELAKRIEPFNESKDIKDAIRKRINELKKSLDEDKRQLGILLADERKAVEEGDSLVQRYIRILERIGDIFKKQLENEILNQKYENDLIAASIDGKVHEKLDYFQKESTKAVERAKENKLLEEEVITLIEEINKLKEPAKLERTTFEEKTMGMRSLLNKISMFFKGRKEEQTKGLKPAYEKP